MATDTEIEAAIRLQAFIRGAMCRIRVAAVLGSAIDGMLNAKETPDSGDDGSYYGNASKSDGGDDMSLASDDFNAEELQEYLQQKYDAGKEDPWESEGEEDRIVKPSMRKESWIIASPAQEKSKFGTFRSNMKDMTKNIGGTVKERAKMINNIRNLTSSNSRDANSSSMSSIDYDHATPPAQDKPKVKKLGETMTKLLSPKRSSDVASPGNIRKMPIPAPKRKSDYPSPGGTTKVQLPKSARRSSAALMEKVTDYTTSLTPKTVGKKKLDVPRRKSDAFMDKVTVFKDFGDKMKTAKDAMVKKPDTKKKEDKSEFDIDTMSTPKPRELRKSIEAGLFSSQNLELPKMQPLEEAEIEGIQAKIAQLGFNKTRDPSVELRGKDRVVDFAARQYVLHASATKIQALARGYLKRMKDQEAMLRVQRWLNKNQHIKKALVADPSEVTEEERLQAAEAFAQTIEHLVPPELARSASRAAGIGASFVVESLTEREQLRRESGIEHPYKPPSFSTLHNTFEAPQEEETQEALGEEYIANKIAARKAFGTSQEEVTTALGQEYVGKNASVRTRQQKMNAAAVTIQAGCRGYLVRKSKFGSAVSALNWIKEYKLLDKLDAQKKRISHDQSKLEGALDAISKVQSLLNNSATKIQALARGYIVRKFDMKTMMNVMAWVRACKLEIEEEQAPETEQLEDTWIFLENANRWIKEAERRRSASVDATPTEDVAEPELDVNELLATWEYVKRDRSTESSQEQKEDPSYDELQRMKNWLRESDYPFVSSSDDDMRQLWEFLDSQQVHVDAFRDEDWDEKKSSGFSIQYIDEDLSRFYGKIPSIKALIEFWSFSRKHDVESLAVARLGSQKVLQPTGEAAEHIENKPDQQPPEVAKNKVDDKLVPESEPGPEMELAKEEAKPAEAETETETEEAKTVADEGSDSEASVEPLPEIIKKPKRRAATNIDGMMSSLKWLKKKGLDLNRIKGGTSTGKATSDVASRSGTLAKLQLAKGKTASSTRIPDAGPKMSSALNWLENKGLDISEAVSKQLAEDPTPDEMTEVVKKMESHKGTTNLKVPTVEEMKQTMKWVKIQESTKKLKKKKKKKAKEVEIKSESQRSTIPEKKPAEKEPAPVKSKEPSEAGVYETDALEWLNTGDENIEGAAYFDKLDKTLPGRDSQTNEHRAKEIAKAMKWVDKQGLLAPEAGEKTETISDGDQSVTGNDDDDDLPPKPLKPPKAVQKKLDAKSPKKLTKKGVASKTSKSKGSKPKASKKKESGSRSNSPDHMESRSRSVSPDASSTKKKKKSKDGKTLSKKANMSARDMMTSPKKKKTTLMKMKTGEEDPERDYELAVAWLTYNDENMEDAKYFKKLDKMVPQNPDHALEDRARELVKALNWVRRTSNKNKEAKAAPEPEPSTANKATKTTKSPKLQSPKRKIKLVRKTDDENVMNLKDLVKVQKTRKSDIESSGKKSESTPEQDFENALNFIRIKEEGGDVMECEDANYFKKLDNMLPKKGTSEERAKEMVKMLGWLRKKGKA